MNKEIANLQQEFDRVFIKHDKTDTLDGKGGETVVHLVKGESVFVGKALCHADDQFNRRLGRQIAIGRALHAYEVFLGNKEERAGSITSGIGYKVYGAEGERATVVVDRYV